MSYEITEVLKKKSIDLSKYIYSSSKPQPSPFIFEISFIQLNSQKITLRQIKKSLHGMLVSSENAINYEDINKCNITVIPIDNIDDHKTIEFMISHNKSSTIFINDNIFIEAKKNNDLLELYYKII